MSDIAFIGQEPLLRVFTYYGAEVFPAASAQEAEATLRDLTADGQSACRVVYIDETLAADMRDTIAALNRQPLPVISMISSRGTPDGLGKNVLRALVRKATGVDMSIDE